MRNRTNRHGPTHPGRRKVLQMALKQTPSLIPTVRKILMSDRSPRAKWRQIRAEIQLSSIHPVYHEVRQREVSRQ